MIKHLRFQFLLSMVRVEQGLRHLNTLQVIGITILFIGLLIMATIEDNPSRPLELKDAAKCLGVVALGFTMIKMG